MKSARDQVEQRVFGQQHAGQQAEHEHDLDSVAKITEPPRSRPSHQDDEYTQPKED